MSAPNDGGPAFPQPLTKHPTGGFTHPSDGYGLGGMSLRDKFAESALIGLLAEPFASGSRSTLCVITNRESGDGTNAADHFAEGAYALADAMLRAREVRP